MSAPPAPLSDPPFANSGAPGVPSNGGAPALASGPQPTPAPDAMSEPVAPADLIPTSHWSVRLLWYSGAMILALALAVCGMQIWDRDLRAPFYYDLDALLYLPLARSIVEQGFWNCWHVDRLGAPGTQ